MIESSQMNRLSEQRSDIIHQLCNVFTFGLIRCCGLFKENRVHLFAGSGGIKKFFCGFFYTIFNLCYLKHYPLRRFVQSGKLGCKILKISIGFLIDKIRLVYFFY
mgnify:CR=1 FL=1